MSLTKISSLPDRARVRAKFKTKIFPFRTRVPDRNVTVKNTVATFQGWRKLCHQHQAIYKLLLICHQHRISYWFQHTWCRNQCISYQHDILDSPAMATPGYNDISRCEIRIWWLSWTNWWIYISAPPMIYQDFFVLIKPSTSLQLS